MEGKLTELVGRLKEAAGKNLESVVLYGSAARSDFHPGISDLNVLCTLVSIDLLELQLLSPVVRWWTREMKEPAPLFFLTEELRRSTDVFAIESWDIKKSHRVLFGRDPVADLEIPMNLHRVEVEHELRLLLLKLRQHVLHSGRNELEMTVVLKKTISGAKTLLRHTLLAFGEEPPVAANDIFARIEQLTGANAETFAAIYEHRESKVWKKDPAMLYDGYMRALEKVVTTLDTMVPKKQWQRMGA
ncbi:MAG TPA: nucleotidyltransferase domain-containing protein [Candidatus Acidoferrum sp.]|jgi:predicted nucleotidyltransferase|nr:nucleotidyltransferase domain-containing protein [Candidatus Acidoferrum sp.]